MPSILLKSLLVGAVIATSVPALAETPTPKTTLRYDAKSGKYCLNQPPVTGSHLTRVLCQTAERWTKDGLNMPKSPKLAQK